MQFRQPPAAESKQQSEAELARVVDQLSVLGAQFDADKNQELSPQEQEAMQKYVAEKFGRVWAQRLKIFLKDADPQVKQSNCIQIDRAHPSCIVLPVVAGK